MGVEVNRTPVHTHTHTNTRKVQVDVNVALLPMLKVMRFMCKGMLFPSYYWINLKHSMEQSFTLILFSLLYPCLQSGLFPSGFPAKTL